jgi:hypothetical protein
MTSPARYPSIAVPMGASTETVLPVRDCPGSTSLYTLTSDESRSFSRTSEFIVTTSAGIACGSTILARSSSCSSVPGTHDLKRVRHAGSPPDGRVFRNQSWSEICDLSFGSPLNIRAQIAPGRLGGRNCRATMSRCFPQDTPRRHGATGPKRTALAANGRLRSSFLPGAPPKKYTSRSGVRIAARGRFWSIIKAYRKMFRGTRVDGENQRSRQGSGLI